MYFRFENLDVWKDSRKFVSKIYSITRAFPKDEQFGLTSQIRRAAVSIILNITEGSDRKSDSDFKRFLRMSIGSVEEVVSAFYIAMDQNMLAKNDFDSMYEDANKLVSRINTLMKKLS